MENIINNPEQYQQTVRKLGEVASRLSLKNEKVVDFSLKYLDKMQTIFNAYEKSGDFASISEQLNKIIAQKKAELSELDIQTDSTSNQ